MGSLPLRTLGRLLCFNYGIFLISAWRLKSFDIPRSGIVGGSVTLSCDWEIDESEKLYSVKFYRDGRQFFRYIPEEKYGPRFTTFPQDGVYPDKGESLKIHKNTIQFQLTNLKFLSRGSFQCEVLVAEPSFSAILSEKKYLSIMWLPEVPRVFFSGFPTKVWLGDRLEGNCTFADSIPLADITIYLNNEKVINSDGVELINYFPMTFGEGYLATMGLKFPVAPQHFKNGVLEIKCEAALFDKRWEALKTIAITQSHTHQIEEDVETVGKNQGSSDKVLPNRNGFFQPLVLLSSVLILFLNWI